MYTSQRGRSLKRKQNESWPAPKSSNSKMVSNTQSTGLRNTSLITVRQLRSICFTTYFNRDIVQRKTRQTNHLRLPSIKLECTKKAFYYHGCEVFNRNLQFLLIVCNNFYPFEKQFSISLVRTSFKYSLTSPYRHLYNTDTSLLRTVRLVLEMPSIIHSLPL